MKKERTTVLAMTLALAMTICCLTGCGSSAPADTSISVTQLANGGILCLKVNPEIAIAYDNDGLVTGITARNDDALKILSNYTGFQGKQTRTVVSELVTAIGEAGYFVEEIDGETRKITIEIEPGSALPNGTFLNDVIDDVKDAVNAHDWQTPLNIEGTSDYGLTDYVDTDYGPGNDGITDYDDTDYGPNNDGVTDYDDTDYGPNNDGVTDYDDTDYGPNSDGVTDYSDYGQVVIPPATTTPPATTPPATTPPATTTPPAAPGNSNYGDSNYGDSGYNAPAATMPPASSGNSGYGDSSYGDSGYQAPAATNPPHYGGSDSGYDSNYGGGDSGYSNYS